MPETAPARRTRRVLQTRVQDVRRLTPKLIRIVVSGDDLDGFGVGAYTDHWPRVRTFTVQHWDAGRRELTIDFVDHGDSGVAGPWATSAQPGDGLQLMGPGGAYTPDPDADWHLMAGDESVLPAISASLARVPAGVPVHVVVEVDGPEDEVPLETPGDLRVQWLHRRDRNGTGDLVPGALRALDFPAGTVHAFVHGEASMDLGLLEARPRRRGLARGQGRVEPAGRGGRGRRGLSPVATVASRAGASGFAPRSRTAHRGGRARRAAGRLQFSR
jgi:NADPH-dependent ferric siderophore reductase